MKFSEKIPPAERPAGGILPPVMTPLPLGAVKPLGWLGEQIRLTVNGYFSHMVDISFFMREDNGWLVPGAKESPDGNPSYARIAWEEQMYWLRGAYKLALVTGDEKLTAICDKYFDAFFASRKPDGYFGPDCLYAIDSENGPVPDVWPHFVAAEILSDLYDATKDERVLDLLHGFFTFCADLPEDKFIPPRDKHFRWQGVIQNDRCCDAVPVIHKVFRLTGDEKMIELCRRLETINDREPREKIEAHVVNFAERFRYPAQRYPLSHDPEDFERSRRRYESHMEKWGQMPGGLWAADENTREGKTDPRQATETCAMSEAVKSFTYLASLSGESVWSDRSERIMFNSYPASHTPDYTGLHYLTADNQPTLDALDHDYDNKGMMTRYSAFEYRCCQHNTGMAWPNYVSSTFAETADGSLAALSFAPCEVDYRLPSGRVRIVEETDYPFVTDISFRIFSDSPFSFAVRIPSWCEGGSAVLRGERSEIPARPGFMFFDVADGDALDISFKASVRFDRYPLNNDCVSVGLGPLDFSLKYREKWTAAEIRTDRAGREWTDWDVEAEDPIFPALDLSSPVTVKRKDMTGNPFTPDSAPVELSASGYAVPGWGMGEENTVDPVPPSPPATEGGAIPLRLVPLGCMRVRLSCFPHVGEPNFGGRS
ncbi:MAG: glycoside hydrolase family 127 protein [Clostridia bacterium]|nr:glycoside hydrolase family 127 protein [Clostridia bacterium]